MTKDQVWPVTSHDLEVLAVALVNRLGGSTTFQPDRLLELSEQVKRDDLTLEIIKDPTNHSVTLRVKRTKR